jgi:hypothetical protein
VFQVQCRFGREWFAEEWWASISSWFVSVAAGGKCELTLKSTPIELSITHHQIPFSLHVKINSFPFTIRRDYQDHIISLHVCMYHFYPTTSEFNDANKPNGTWIKLFMFLKHSFHSYPSSHWRKLSTNISNLVYICA